MKSNYMVVLNGKPSEWNAQPDAARNEILARYMGWVEKLKGEGRFQGGSQLLPAHTELKSQNGKIVVDGPFPETKEVVTGYFLISADSLDEATEVAKGCPGLTHGSRIQVYAMPNRG